jgi:Nucleotidyl transferase AbiEii toxin, Type IV TA system
MAGARIGDAIKPVLSALNEMGIRYFAGGSVASSIHGIARYTQDVDLVADLKPGQIDELVSRLVPEFYADAGQIRDSIRYDRSFNVIHVTSGFKIDVFPFGRNDFHEREWGRSDITAWYVEPATSLEIRVASPEDTILAKLAWYRNGGQTSDRQWTS